MVAARSLYRSWNAKPSATKKCHQTNRTHGCWSMRTIQQRDSVPVLAIDYVPIDDRAWLTNGACIQKHGIIAWSPDAALSSVGVGSVEAGGAVRWCSTTAMVGLALN